MESAMKDIAKHLGPPAATNAPSLPTAVDHETWQAELDKLLVREKAHTREGDAIAAARRRLPMVEVDYGMLHMTVYGRQEPWENSPEGWPKREVAESFPSNGRPISLWSRLAAVRSDDLGTAGR